MSASVMAVHYKVNKVQVRFDLLSDLIKFKLIRIVVENDLVCNSARIRLWEKSYANSLLFN